jgi:hypothetical protein
VDNTGNNSSVEEGGNANRRKSTIRRPSTLKKSLSSLRSKLSSFSLGKKNRKESSVSIFTQDNDEDDLKQADEVDIGDSDSDKSSSPQSDNSETKRVEADDKIDEDEEDDAELTRFDSSLMSTFTHSEPPPATPRAQKR